MVYNMPMPLISGVHIDNFRGLRDFHLEGARMFNLLVGPSEIGKTSVLEAISLVTGAGDITGCVNLNRHARGAIVQNQGDAAAAVASFFHEFRPLPILLGVEIITKTFGAVRVDEQIVPVLGDAVVTEQNVSVFGAQGATSLLAEGSFNGLKGSIKVSGKISGKGHSILRLNEYPPRADPFIMEEPASRNGKGKKKAPLSEEETGELRTTSLFVNQPMHGIAIEMALANKKTKDIVAVLKRINPDIADVAMIGNKAHVDIGLEKMVSMHVTGDGVRRAMTILGYLCAKEYKVHLEDEIGAGIYFGSQPRFLRAVLQFAKQEDKQIFATTHNKDVLLALKKVLAEDAGLRDDVAVFSFMPSKRGNVRATPYLYRDIDRCLENDIEIR